MTDQEKEIVARASVPMTIANIFRWIFLMVALLLVLFIFFGNKLWQGAAWYDAFAGRAYSFLMWDILLMLISNIIRIIFAARYNRIVKNL